MMWQMFSENFHQEIKFLKILETKLQKIHHKTSMVKKKMERSFQINWENKMNRWEINDSLKLMFK